MSFAKLKMASYFRLTHICKSSKHVYLASVFTQQSEKCKLKKDQTKINNDK